MISICVVTATRAEYGLLKPLIQALKAEKEVFSVALAVTGTHLSPNHGMTINDIFADGMDIDTQINILVDSDQSSSVCKSMGLAISGFGDYFQEKKFDLVILLGDRYETLSIASAAVVSGIPIVHLHGGEVTEGANDDFFRHAITKLSMYHFTSSEQHRMRVIQLGESPERVYNVGAIGLDNIVNAELMLKSELSESIGFDLDGPYAVVTFHPVTLDRDDPVSQITEVLNALVSVTDIKYIITKANSDLGGSDINRYIDWFVSEHQDRMKAFFSLGQARYLAALKYAEFVVGNSSSGIIEAPSLGIPTIDIGNRQKGRLAAQSVIHCDTERGAIAEAIRTVRSSEYRTLSRHITNPYGHGGTAAVIVNTLKNITAQGIQNNKVFYDLNAEKVD